MKSLIIFILLGLVSFGTKAALPDPALICNQLLESPISKIRGLDKTDMSLEVQNIVNNMIATTKRDFDGRPATYQNLFLSLLETEGSHQEIFSNHLTVDQKDLIGSLKKAIDDVSIDSSHIFAEDFQQIYARSLELTKDESLSHKSSEYQDQILGIHFLLAMTEIPKVSEYLASIGLTSQAIKSTLTETKTSDVSFPQKPVELGKEAHSSEQEQSAFQKVLDKYTENLDLQVKQGNFSPILGRGHEIDSIIDNSMRHPHNNTMVVGSAKVGKTALVHEFVRQVHEGLIPELAVQRSLSLDAIKLMSSRLIQEGQLEETIKKITQALKAYEGQTLLHIENLNRVLNLANPDSFGPYQIILDYLQPIFNDPNIIVISETTPKSMAQLNSDSEKSIDSFHQLEIKKIESNVVPGILEASFKNDKYNRDLHLSDEALIAAARFSEYVGGREHMQNAVDLLNRARDSKISNQRGGRIRKINTKISELELQKRSLEIGGGSPLDKEFQEIINKIKDLEALKKDTQIADSNPSEITREDIFIAARELGATENLLDDVKVKLAQLEPKIREYVVGQDVAVQTVIKVLRKAMMDLRDTSKPIANIMFIGPSGVGKTELSRAISLVFFGTEDINMIRGETLKQGHQVSSIQGSPPGYVGTGTDTYFTRKLRKNPNSVILFDEAEKAHSDVWDFFMGILDDGVATTGAGEEIDASRSLVFFTTNKIKDLKDFGIDTNKMSDEEIENGIKQALVDIGIRSEIIGRFSHIIYFKPLEENDLLKIVDLKIKAVNKLIEKAKYDLHLTATDKAKKQLAKEGYSEQFGVRELQRVIDKKVVDLLIEETLKDRHIGKKKAILDFKKPKGSKKKEFTLTFE
jgi:ATP-dependent Clp protease ATP-binding subunit ClpA